MFYPGGVHNGVQPSEMHSDQGHVPKHSLQHGAGVPSKIPMFSGAKHSDGGGALKKTSFSAPTRISNSLPPIVGGSQVGAGQTGSNSRGHSNPEKNKKYAQNHR